MKFNLTVFHAFYPSRQYRTSKKLVEINKITIRIISEFWRKIIDIQKNTQPHNFV